MGKNLWYMSVSISPRLLYNTCFVSYFNLIWIVIFDWLVQTSLKSLNTIYNFPPLIPHSFLHFRLSCNLSAVSAKDSVFFMNCSTYKSLFFTLSTSRWSYSFFSRKSVTKTINRAQCNHLYIISIRKKW